MQQITFSQQYFKQQFSSPLACIQNFPNAP